MKRISRRLVAAIFGVAGLGAAASAQSLTIEFRADRTQAAVGETVHWHVVVFFEYPDPTAEFAGFQGDFAASDPGLGLATNMQHNMFSEALTPTASGASVTGLYFFGGCLFQCIYARNGDTIYLFDVEVTDDAAPLWYDALGIAEVRPDEGIFTLSDEFCRPYVDCQQWNGPGRRLAVRTDLVNFRGCDLTDLAEPFGIKDGADIIAFAGLFSTGAPILDLAEPFGVHDLADIVAFIERFAAACP